MYDAIISSLTLATFIDITLSWRLDVKELLSFLKMHSYIERKRDMPLCISLSLSLSPCCYWDDINVSRIYDIRMFVIWDFKLSLTVEPWRATIAGKN